MPAKNIYTTVPCDECDGTGRIKVTKLSALRKRAGLDQQEVADKLRLTRTSVSNIELGKQSITLDKVKPLADLYGISEYEMYDIAKMLAKEEL